MATIDVAYLAGTMLQMETIEDAFEKAIARYEYPYVDGADLEDMGQKARTMRVRCYFWDDGAGNNTYDDHRALLDLLNRRDLLEFEHPKYGLLQVMVERVSVRHDDRIRAAEVDLDLVQQLREERPVARADDVQASIEGQFATAQDEMIAAYAEEIKNSFGAASDTILDKVLSEDLTILEQFTDVSRQVRGYVKTVDLFVRRLDAQVSAVVNPANSLIAAIDYGTSLPGRVIGAVARCAERYALLYASLTSAPVRFFDRFALAMTDLAGKLGFSRQISGAFAAQGALTAASIYKADEQDRQLLRRAEGTASFDVLGGYSAPAAVSTVLTAPDLERSLAAVRAMIQTAVDLDRSQESLKAMARSLLEHVNTVKLEREKIQTVLLDNPMPLHLVCLRYGLPYNYAERILSINSIRHPNFTGGEVAVYVR